MEVVEDVGENRIEAPTGGVAVFCFLSSNRWGWEVQMIWTDFEQNRCFLS